MGEIVSNVCIARPLRCEIVLRPWQSPMLRHAQRIARGAEVDKDFLMNRSISITLVAALAFSAAAMAVASLVLVDPQLHMALAGSGPAECEWPRLPPRWCWALRSR